MTAWHFFSTKTILNVHFLLNLLHALAMDAPSMDAPIAMISNILSLSINIFQCAHPA